MERIIGSNVPEKGIDTARRLWFTIHRGHMRAVFVSPEDERRIWADLAELGSRTFDLYAVGWEELL